MFFQNFGQIDSGLVVDHVLLEQILQPSGVVLLVEETFHPAVESVLFEQQSQPQFLSPACGVEVSVDFFPSLFGDRDESGHFDGDLCLAVVAGEVSWALTDVGVDLIDTDSAVLARVGSAIINVGFAMNS
jgi:hypothetical protein